jgi:hypothetical protein
MYRSADDDVIITDGAHGWCTAGNNGCRLQGFVLRGQMARDGVDSIHMDFSTLKTSLH